MGRSSDGSKNGWAHGALALGCSLQPVLRLVRVDLLAMCLGFSTEVIARIESVGWKCFTPNPIPNPAVRSYWQWSYTQVITPFSLIQYKRVLSLDEDIVVVQPSLVAGLLMETLPRGHILATQDCMAALQLCEAGQTLRHGKVCWNESEASNEVNTGVMLLRPNLTMYEEMVNVRHTTRSLNSDGQGFLSSYFRGRVRRLPDRYNYICNSLCIGAFDSDTGNYRHEKRTPAQPGINQSVAQAEMMQADSVARSHVQRRSIGLLHYQYKPKPWSCRLSQLELCGHALKLANLTGYTRVDTLHTIWFAYANKTIDQCSLAPSVEDLLPSSESVREFRLSKLESTSSGSQMLARRVVVSQATAQL